MPKPPGHKGEWTVADEARQKLANKPPTTPPVSPVTPTPTPTPTAPAGQPQTAQGYAGLTNKGGTIYLGDTPFSSEADLATHLGIKPHEINWGNIPQAETPTEISTDVLDTPVTTEDIQAQVTSPIEGIQSVFGADWTPAPIFEQLGLTEQGIYGAVRIKGMNDVYTIGEGGRKETAESYKERFGTDSQEGIVGEISMEEAIALGIVVGADSILEPLIPTDPYDVWTHFRDEGKEEIIALRKTLLETTQALIDKMMGYGETKAEAKEGEEERLGIDEKDKAISDAQKVRNDLYNSYEKLIVDLSHSTMTTAHIGGLQAKTRAQRAVELAPLDSNILIAQNAYARAKDLLDDWSTDYDTAIDMQMAAAKLNIDMITGTLNREQQENLEEAKIKFAMWEQKENERLSTAEEVKKLMLMYPSAGVSIADNWEDAYKKISPFIQNEADFEQKMRDIDLKIAQKALTKPHYAGTSGGGEKIVTTSQGATMPQEVLDEIRKALKEMRKGNFGVEGAREGVIEAVAQRYTAYRQAISDHIYGAVRDGYESSIQERWKPSEGGDKGRTFNKIPG